MGHLCFDEGELVGQLERLSARRRVAFAAACAQRLLPAYARYAEYWGRGAPGELSPMIERLWRDLEGDPMNAEEVQQYIDGCDRLTPREEDGEWVEGQAQAEDAVMALAYAFECRQTGGAREAAWAGRCAFEAVHYFVRNPGPAGRALSYPQVQAELARVLLHPVVQAELARQRRDLEELHRVHNESDIAEVVARLRDRARIEAATLLG